MVSPFRFFPIPLALAAAFACHAETILDIDFQNYEPGERQLAAAEVRADALGLLTASENGISVETDGKTGIASNNPKLQKGFGECTSTPEGGGCFTSVGLPGAYAKYVGQRGYGTCTVATVFQPHFAGKLIGNRRACFFANNYQGTSLDAVSFGVGKQLGVVFGIGSSASPQRRLMTEQPDWDPAKWYFIAASWAPLERPTLYWRELPSEKGEFSTASEPLEDDPNEIRRGIRLGNCGTNDASLYGAMPMMGKMAYFLWTGSYTGSEEAYDALYKEIVKPK